eukprot:PhF_6_TR930/c0_g3_i1/m.1621
MNTPRNSILLRPRRPLSNKNAENIENEYAKEVALQELKRQKHYDTEAFLRLSRKEVPVDQRAHYEQFMQSEQRAALSMKAQVKSSERTREAQIAQEAMLRDLQKNEIEMQERARRRNAERQMMLDNMKAAEERRLNKIHQRTGY